MDERAWPERLTFQRNGDSEACPFPNSAGPFRGRRSDVACPSEPVPRHARRQVTSVRPCCSAVAPCETGPTTAARRRGVRFSEEACSNNGACRSVHFHSRRQISALYPHPTSRVLLGAAVSSSASEATINAAQSPSAQVPTSAAWPQLGAGSSRRGHILFRGCGRVGSAIRVASPLADSACARATQITRRGRVAARQQLGPAGSTAVPSRVRHLERCGRRKQLCHRGLCPAF